MKLKRALIMLMSTIFLCLTLTVMSMQLPQFGKAPSGKRLERIKQSPNYKDGKFRNRIHTPILPEGYTMAGAVYKTFIVKNPRKFPTDSLPSIKTDLLALPKERNP